MSNFVRDFVLMPFTELKESALRAEKNSRQSHLTASCGAVENANS